MHRIALASAVLACLASPVAAQNIACHPEAGGLAAKLGAQYGEKLTAAGVDANGGLVQVYSNTESGTWTIAITIPSGPTCIVSSGEGFTIERPAPVTPGRSS